MRPVSNSGSCFLVKSFPSFARFILSWEGYLNDSHGRGARLAVGIDDGVTGDGLGRWSINGGVGCWIGGHGVQRTNCFVFQMNRDVKSTAD